MLSINKSDISVVVQGAIGQNTKKCLASIRKYLVGSEIILSTWKGSENIDLDYDFLVLNDDPGPNGYIRIYPEVQISNLDRQIISSREGVKCASKKYVLKIRTDMELDGCSFLHIYEKWGDLTSYNTLFTQRLMVEGISTLLTFPFSVSDWWCFGLKEDVEKWYSCALSEEFPNAVYFNKNNKKFIEKPAFERTICRYAPEQYICYMFLKKYFKMYYPHMFHWNANIDKIYKDFVVKNLICAEASKSNVVLPKALNIISPKSYEHNMTYARWVDIIKKNYPLQLDVTEMRSYYDEQDKMHKIYEKNSHFWDELEWVNIIQNYSKREIVNESEAKIDGHDITFILTPIDLGTKGEDYYRTIKSIRKNVPGACILVVAFRDMNISKLNMIADVVIIADEDKIATNYSNRLDYFEFMYLPPQIYYMRMALQFVKTRYVCRIRLELTISTSKFIENVYRLYSAFDKSNKRWKLLDSKIVVSNYYTHDSEYENGNNSFTISDYFQFGSKGDFMKMWSEFSGNSYFEYFSKNKKIKSIHGYNCRYNNEQVLPVDLVKRYREKLSCPFPRNYFDNDEELTFAWEGILASNFIVADANRIGIKPSVDLIESMLFLRFMEIFSENVFMTSRIREMMYSECIRTNKLQKKDAFIQKIKYKQHHLMFRINPVLKNNIWAQESLKRIDDSLNDSIGKLRRVGRK